MMMEFLVMIFATGRMDKFSGLSVLLSDAPVWCCIAHLIDLGLLAPMGQRCDLPAYAAIITGKRHFFSSSPHLAVIRRPIVAFQKPRCIFWPFQGTQDA
jgi:hypothetical protein